MTAASWFPVAGEKDRYELKLGAAVQATMWWEQQGVSGWWHWSVAGRIPERGAASQAEQCVARKAVA